MLVFKAVQPITKPCSSGGGGEEFQPDKYLTNTL